MEDIFGVILSNIDAGSTFKSSRLVCRLWLKVTKKLFPRGHLKFANHIQTIVEKVLEYNKHAEKPIEIHGEILSTNSTWEFIQKHPEINWDMQNFVQYGNVTDENVDFCKKVLRELDIIAEWANREFPMVRSTHLSWKAILEIGISRIQRLPKITLEMFKEAEEYFKTNSMEFDHNYLISRLQYDGDEEVIVAFN